MGLIAGGAALIGSFLPWVSIVSVFGTIEIAGTAGDGKLTAAAAVVAMLFGYAGLAKGKKVLVVLAVAAASAGFMVAVYDWTNLQSNLGGASEGVAASVGYGLYLCTVGLGVCVGGLLGAMPQRAGKWQTALRR